MRQPQEQWYRYLYNIKIPSCSFIITTVSIKGKLLFTETARNAIVFVQNNDISRYIKYNYDSRLNWTATLMYENYNIYSYKNFTKMHFFCVVLM
jgi:hypothetical protein